jgi:hypothetical protein
MNTPAPKPAEVDALISGKLKPVFRGRTQAHRAWCQHWRAVLRIAVVDRGGASGCWAAVYFGLPRGGKTLLGALNGLRLARKAK